MRLFEGRAVSHRCSNRTHTDVEFSVEQFQTSGREIVAACGEDVAVCVPGETISGHYSAGWIAAPKGGYIIRVWHVPVPVSHRS